MRTIFAEKNAISSGLIKISDKSEINHVKNVLRLKQGDEIRVIDGEKSYITEILNLDKKIIELKIVSELIGEADGYNLVIALAMLKSDKMDLAIQKLTEIGVDKIIPILTERGVVKLKEKKVRWNKISIEALKQCGGINLLEISNPRELKKIDFSNYNKIVIFHPGSKNKVSEIINQSDKDVIYLIGPEGGFTDNEMKFLEENGAITAKLGSRILRAETAAIVAGGLILNEIR